MLRLLLLLCFLSTVATVARADLDRSHPPAPGPAPAASFPDYREVTLPNGLKVFIIENHRQPTVTFRLLVRAGAVCDGAKPGTAEIAAELLNKGTAHRRADAFAQETDALGAVVEAGAGEDATYVFATGLTRFLPQLLDLFSDVILHPAFPEEELNKEKARSLSQLAQARQRPPWLLSTLRDKLLYGATHPYGAIPTEAIINALTRADVQAWHRTWFHPNNASLAIVGDVRADDLLPLIERTFGAWEKADVPKPQLPALPAPAQTRTIHLINRPGSVQSTFAVAATGVPRNNADLAELGVANTILGGGFSGRLFQNLRERHGYTYGAGSSFSSLRLGGVFAASAEVRNEVTLPALLEVLAEIERLRSQPVLDVELTMQRNYLAGNYLLSLESPIRTAERVQEIDLYGLPGDYFKTYARRVSNVSAEQVEALAKKYLPAADGVTIVVVGEAREVRPKLEELGKVIVYNLDFKAQPAASN